MRTKLMRYFFNYQHLNTLAVVNTFAAVYAYCIATFQSSISVARLADGHCDINPRGLHSVGCC